jgi:isopropylmalate/homocitrate/citramalate synthase
VPNKKFCGWSNDEMRRYNQLMSEVRDNQNKQYTKEVEDSTLKTLAERHKSMLGVRHKNSRKRRHHVSPKDTDDEEQEDEDNSIIPEDELVLLAMEPV